MKVKSFIKNFIIFFCLSFVFITAITYLYSFIDPGARLVIRCWKEGNKIWDKVFLGIFTISLLLFPAVAGLDVGRFKWSQLGFPWVIPGIVLALVKFILWHWAIVKNKHLEATVSIQTDRDHKVVTDGPLSFCQTSGLCGYYSRISLRFFH